MEIEQVREAWLDSRKKGIGGSDAAAAVGLNPWKSNVELWEEKTGRKQPEDISYKPAVKYGKAAEAPIRELFKLDFPQFRVDYDEFGIIANMKEYPWLFATLDGELTDKQGRKGILEIKTSKVNNAAQRMEWAGNKMPQHYYIQVLHQLLATGYEYAILKAHLKRTYGDEIFIQTKHYFINRNEVSDDMWWLLTHEIEFWKCVQDGRRPDLILPAI